MSAPDTQMRPLTGKHREAVLLAEQHATAIWEGAVRSGKTVGTFVAWERFARHAPAGDLVMIGKTERTLIRNVIRPMQAMYGKRHIKLNRGAGEVTMFGRMCYLVGANDERSSDKIRGMTLAGAYGDEITIWPESFWEMLLSRFSVDGARLIGTTNPDNPNHWLVKALDRCVVWLRHDGELEHFDDDEDRVDLDLARFSFVIDDNPTLTEKFKRRLKASYTGVFYKRFILGQWVLADGVIYDMWDASHHVTDIDPTDVAEWHVAIDDGTAGTFAAQLIACCPDRLVVARELRWNAKEKQRQLTDAQKSTELRRWLDECAEGTRIVDGDKLPALHGCDTPRRIHVDPSATSLIRQLELDGWRCTVTKARNDVLGGIRYTSSLIACDRLTVHRSCTGLIGEIGGYVWDPKAAERGEDKPVKVNDHHCLIAGTMVQTSRGQVPIESVAPGDLVLTRQGFAPVRWSAMTGRGREVWRVAMSDGSSFVATPEHPVWVAGQWLRVDALRYGDILTTCPVSKQSSTTASRSGGTPTLPGGLIAAIGRRARRTASEVCAGFMRSYGSRRTARSLTGATSITPISTPSTTIFRTWFASPVKSTRRCITSVLWRWGSSTRRAPWRTNEPLSGTGATKAERGIGSTASAPGRDESQSLERASSVAPSMKLGTSRARQGSARMRARAHGVVHRDSTTSSATVRVAALPSSSTATTRPGSVDVHVRSVTPLANPADVYNLSIDGPHEFFANGVLVHNCDATRYGVMGTDRHWWNWLAASGDPREAESTLAR